LLGINKITDHTDLRYCCEQKTIVFISCIQHIIWRTRSSLYAKKR